VDLSWRERHQRAGGEAQSDAAQVDGKNRGQHESKNAEQAGDIFQGGEGVGPGGLVPKISAKNVEKAGRWQDCARKSGLQINVSFRQVRIRGESRLGKGFDVFAIEIFVETDAGIARLGMQDFQEM